MSALRRTESGVPLIHFKSTIIIEPLLNHHSKLIHPSCSFAIISAIEEIWLCAKRLLWPIPARDRSEAPRDTTYLRLALFATRTIA